MLILDVLVVDIVLLIFFEVCVLHIASSTNYYCNGSEYSYLYSFFLFCTVYLQVFAEEVTVTEGTTVFLHCEMSGYILPDEDFLWFKGEEVIRLGGRFSITYSNGTANSAAIGGVSTSFSRVSMLEVTATVLSDVGVYVCRVRDREVFANVTLVVEEDATIFHTPGGEPKRSVVYHTQRFWPL